MLSVETAKNPDILTYVCGLELGTLSFSGHSMSQILANGKASLCALGDDLGSTSRVMATSFVQMAHNLSQLQGVPYKMAGESLDRYMSRRNPNYLVCSPARSIHYGHRRKVDPRHPGLLCRLLCCSLNPPRCLVWCFRHGTDGTSSPPQGIWPWR
jgi:hypothetical protein